MQTKTTINPHRLKVQLILIDNCRDCQQAEVMWRAVCEEHDCDFEVLDIEKDVQASHLVDVLELMAFPALLVDGHVRAVGAFDEQQANAIFGKK